MSRIEIIRPGSKRSVKMRAREAHKLVQAGKFNYVDPTQTALPRAKPKPQAPDAARRASPVLNKTTGKPVEETQAEGSALEDKTKEQIVTYLRSYGQKVDVRQSKAELLKQAQRYKRRDMRAE